MSVAAALATIALKTWAWQVTGSVGLLSDALESLINLAAALLALSMLRLAAVAAGRGASLRPVQGGVFRERHRRRADRVRRDRASRTRRCRAWPIRSRSRRRCWASRSRRPPRRINLGLRPAADLGRQAPAQHRAGGRRPPPDERRLDLGRRSSRASRWSRPPAGTILDPLIALAVAVHIVLTGFMLMRRSFAGLLDAAIPEAERAEIEKIFAEYRKRYGVEFHALLTRQAGARRFISFHLLVPDAWPVDRAHQLSEEIESRIARWCRTRSCSATSSRSRSRRPTTTSSWSAGKLFSRAALSANRAGIHGGGELALHRQRFAFQHAGEQFARQARPEQAARAVGERAEQPVAPAIGPTSGSRSRTTARNATRPSSFSGSSPRAAPGRICSSRCEVAGVAVGAQFRIRRRRCRSSRPPATRPSMPGSTMPPRSSDVRPGPRLPAPASAGRARGAGAPPVAAQGAARRPHWRARRPARKQ